MEQIDIRALIEEHGKAVYRFCFMLVKNKTDTDDLYQETFLTAMESSAKIDLNQNPKAYLMSIAAQLWKNKARKYARREKIAPNVEFIDDYIARPFGELSTPEEIVISNELRSRLQQAAEALNDKLKITLYMHYTADMSVEEIATALNIPLGTVKSRLHNARKALKKILEAKVV